MKSKKCIRALAAIMCMCMLMGLIPGGYYEPVAKAVDTDEPIAYTFTFSGYGWDKSLSTHFKTFDLGVNWRYYGYSESAEWKNETGSVVQGDAIFPINGQYPVGIHPSGGIYTYMPSNTQWIALELKVPKTGKYSISGVGNKSALGGKADMYLFKSPELKDGQTLEAAVNAALEDENNYLGQENYYNFAASALAFTGIGSENVSIREAGNYVLVIKGTGIDSYNNNYNNYYMALKSLTMTRIGDLDPPVIPSNEKVVINFTKAVKGDIPATKYEHTDNVFEFNTLSPDWTEVGDKDLLKYDAFMQIKLGDLNRYIAFNVKIPAKGWYDATLNYMTARLGGQTEFYMLPENVELKSENLIEKYRLGDVRSHADTQGGESENSDAYSTLANGFFAEDEGVYKLVIKNKAQYLNGAGHYAYLKNLTLDGRVETKIQITPKMIKPGDTAEVSVTAVHKNGEEFDLNSFAEFSSDAEGVATVSEDGVVTGVSVGDANISASVTMGKTSQTLSALVRVVEEGYVPVLDTIDFTPGKEAIPVGDKGKFTVSGKFEDGYNADLSNAAIMYSSADETIIKINADGSYEAKDDGIVQVTVTVDDATGNKELTKEIRVGQPAGELITLNFTAMVNDIVKTTYAHTKNVYKFNKLSTGWVPNEGDFIKLNSGTAQLRFYNDLNRWMAFDVNVPAAGWYYMELDHGAHYLGGLFDIYMVPKNDAAIADNMVEKNRVGEVKFHRDTDNGEVEDANAHSAVGMFFAENSGEYTLIFKLKQTYIRGHAHYMYITKMTLTGYPALSEIFFAADKEDIELGDELPTTLSAVYNDGETVDLSDLSINYKSSDNEVASVSADGVIRGESEGSAKITVTAILDGVAREASINVNVTDTSDVLSVELKAPEKMFVRGSEKLEFVANMASQKRIVIPDSAPKSFTLTSVPENIAEISEDGVITANAAGEITVSATVEFKGDTHPTNEVKFTVENSKKSGVSIYTDKERQAMRKNASEIAEYRSQARGYVAAADNAVENLDVLYDMIVAEGLPRYYDVGSQGDPEREKCPYCKVDITKKYGSYKWIVDPLNAPWKIQCPDCRRRFPSNDFGEYYKLGLDERGVFNPEIAKQKNAELEADPDHGGYLKNLLYPEMDEHFDEKLGKLVNEGVHNWGVDDGWGYLTGETLVTGNPQRNIYIAVYLHQLWYGDATTGAGLIRRSMLNLANAYLYTGDAKYGRAGAILLDRVADFYPDYDWYKWHKFRGDSYLGTILDPVWGTGIAKQFAEWYDVFWPAYDDPQVISYLSEKATKYKMNPKNSPAAIRSNAEQGILYAIFDHAKERRLFGNAGTDQVAVATAAVALDTMPETREWLDWIMAPGDRGGNAAGKDGTIPPPRTGGNIIPTLIASVDRDGMGAEAAPGYNGMWASYLLPVAELLADYDKYTGVTLWENPKFMTMFTAHIPLTMSGSYTAQIGDDGNFASTGIGMSISNALTAFRRLGDYRFAQIAYYLNGNSVDGLMYDATIENPKSVQAEILNVIKEHGELSIGSEMIAGYGFSAIRDGAKYTQLNTHRGFWMYYGLTSGHGHADSLNLGMDAFGLNFAPEFGYPSETSTKPPIAVQWEKSTLSHNTVMVDGEEQARNGVAAQSAPKHFDDSGRVKVMDVDRPNAYPQTESYRRTVVMVEVDDTVSYGVDFFRILGGNDHIYSFHSQSDEIFDTQGLDTLSGQTEIVDGVETFVGTYAGPEVPFGKDPDTVVDEGNNSTLNGLRYPPGFTWLYNVRRDATPDNTYAVDFAVKDFRKTLKDGEGLHLRLTMTNDFPLTEVALAKGNPPNYAGNPQGIEFLLARRTGKNLDTLFTTVLEPYRNNRYLESIESVSVEVVGGTHGTKDVVKAVKVTHAGKKRVDYIVYATNNQVVYNVDGKFDFSGFVGVVTCDENGEIVYKYLNDGAVLVKAANTPGAYSGYVKDFTKGLNIKNSIIVDFDGEVDTGELKGRYVYVDNFSAENAVYKIRAAKPLQDGTVELDIGETTLVNKTGGDDGYVYNIAAGQKLRIPLSWSEDTSPTFTTSVTEYSATAGKTLRIPVNAYSGDGKSMTLTGDTLPRGASFDQATSSVVWTPDENQIGEHHAAIKANDGTLSTTLNLKVTVYRGAGNTDEPSTDKPANTPPSPSGNEGSGGGGGGGGASSGGDSSDITKPEDTETEENAGDSTTEDKFVDLENFTWAKDAIYALVDAGVVNGTSENTYSPAKNIKRADFAIMLVRAFGITKGQGENFADVDANKYYAKELLLAKANGIVGGIGDNKFNPEGEITRQDMMLMLSRALEAQGRALAEADESVLAQFADAAQISDYAKSAVASVVEAGIIAGANGRINPLSKATRAEIAVMLDRVLKK